MVARLVEDLNWTVTGIHRATGIDRKTIARIYGTSRYKQERVYTYILHRLEKLVVDGEPLPETRHGRVRSDLFILAVHCAHAEGYTSSAVADHIRKTQNVSCSAGSLCNAVRKGAWVDPRWETGAVDFVRSTGGKLGPSTQNIRRARKNGWKPGIHYDIFV